MTVALMGFGVPGNAASAAPGVIQASTGTLTVKVTDLPAKSAGSVHVAGPGGYSKSVTATVRLAGLKPGKYAVTANAVIVKGTTYVPTVSGAALNLGAGGSVTATAAYFTRIPATTVPLPGSAVKTVTAKGTTLTITLAAPAAALQSRSVAAAALKAGDVIAVGTGPATPDGLLAKVTAVAGKVITATLASVQQAITQGDFAASFSYRYSGTYSALACGGAVTVHVSPALTARVGIAAQWGGPSGTEADADITVSGSLGISETLTAGRKCQLPAIPLIPLKKLADLIVKKNKNLELVGIPEIGLSVSGSALTDTAQTRSVSLAVSGTAGFSYAGGKVTAGHGLSVKLASVPPSGEGTGSVESMVTLEAALNFYNRAKIAVSDAAGVREDFANGGLPADAWDGVAQAGGSVSLAVAKLWSNDAVITEIVHLYHPATRVLGELNRLACPSADVCWATGLEFPSAQAPAESLLLRSSDGGEVWVPQSLPDGTASPNAVACPSAEQCYVIAAEGSQPAIASTSDGGTSWHVTPVGGASTALTHIACPGVGHCVAVGFNAIAVTTDGAHWTVTAPPGSAELADVACPSATVCYAAGGDAGSSLPAILRSGNGGHGWSEVTIKASGSLGAISCPSVTDCVATGGGTNLNALIARTVNGSSWTPVELARNNGLAAGNIACPTTRECLAVGRITEGFATGGGVLRSTDLGLHWTRMPEPNGTYIPLVIACRSASDCELGGGDNTSGVPVIPYISAASTTNDSAAWHIQLP